MTDEKNNISINIDEEQVHLIFVYDRKDSEAMFSKKSDYLHVTMVGLNEINPLHYQPICIIPLNGVDVDNKQKASVLYDAAKILLGKYYEFMSKEDT